MLFKLVPKIRFELITYRLQGGCTASCAISAYLVLIIRIELISMGYKAIVLPFN